MTEERKIELAEMFIQHRHDDVLEAIRSEVTARLEGVLDLSVETNPRNDVSWTLATNPTLRYSDINRGVWLGPLQTGNLLERVIERMASSLRRQMEQKPPPAGQFVYLGIMSADEPHKLLCGWIAWLEISVGRLRFLDVEEEITHPTLGGRP